MKIQVTTSEKVTAALESRNLPHNAWERCVNNIHSGDARQSSEEDLSTLS